MQTDIRNLTVIFLCAAGLFVWAGSADAAKHPGEKMARGFINVWNGHYEVWDEMHETMHYEGPLGFFPGVLKGVGAMSARMLSGAYDIITFCIPVPKNYEPLVEPELNF